MKLPFFFLCVAFLIAGNSYGQNKAIENPITLEELNRRNVVGNLGLPLGTAVEIQAKVVSGRSLRLKGYDSRYLLKVTHVDGKELNPSPIMQFSFPGFVSVELANDTFGLHKMKHGTEAKSLDHLQIEELEKGYVGKDVRLVVYEEGSFRGIPKKLPNDVPSWADSSFYFTTDLTILRDRDTPSKYDKNNQ